MKPQQQRTLMMIIIGFVLVLEYATLLEAVNVTITGPAKINPGQSLNLSCSFSSSKEPSSKTEMSWKFGNDHQQQICKYIENSMKQIPDAFKMRMSCIPDLVKKSLQLSINPVQHNDNGRYWCEVRNMPDADVGKESFDVVVASPTRIATEKDSSHKGSERDSGNKGSGSHDVNCLLLLLLLPIPLARGTAYG